MKYIGKNALHHTKNEDIKKEKKNEDIIKYVHFS